MWIICLMVFLVLLGMSGFVVEVMIFIGFVISDVYNLIFKVLVIFLVVVGVILILIYLLLMLWEILYGLENKKLVEYEVFKDVELCEVFIIGCLLVLIIGIGLYFKIVI